MALPQEDEGFDSSQDATGGQESNETYRKDIVRLTAENAELSKSLKTLSGKIRTSEKSLSKIYKDIEGANEKIRESKTNFIEVLGIFVALFTFVSIDVQLFRADISFLSI